MTEDDIECYATFETKGYPDELLLENCPDQPIPPDYYDLLNYDDDGDYDNNITGTPVDDVLLDNKGVEYAVIPNDEDIYNEIIIDDAGSLISSIDPL